MPLTDEHRAQISQVNAEANAIPFDEVIGAHEPVDWWTDDPDADGSFVCRDYVLLKAEKLQALGWNPHDMTVVLCWTEPVGEPPQREYHAVLAVEVDGETWILDNRADDIYRWDQSPYDYQWDQRQVAGTTEFKSIV